MYCDRFESGGHCARSKNATRSLRRSAAFFSQQRFRGPIACLAVYLALQRYYISGLLSGAVK
jgi:hypothetical protein